MLAYPKISGPRSQDRDQAERDQDDLADQARDERYGNRTESITVSCCISIRREDRDQKYGQADSSGHVRQREKKPDAARYFADAGEGDQIGWPGDALEA